MTQNITFSKEKKEAKKRKHAPNGDTRATRHLRGRVFLYWGTLFKIHYLFATLKDEYFKFSFFSQHKITYYSTKNIIERFFPHNTHIKRWQHHTATMAGFRIASWYIHTISRFDEPVGNRNDEAAGYRTTYHQPASLIIHDRAPTTPYAVDGRLPVSIMVHSYHQQL